MNMLLVTCDLPSAASIPLCLILIICPLILASFHLLRVRKHYVFWVLVLVGMVTCVNEIITSSPTLTYKRQTPHFLTLLISYFSNFQSISLQKPEEHLHFEANFLKKHSNFFTQVMSFYVLCSYSSHILSLLLFFCLCYFEMVDFEGSRRVIWIRSLRW